MTDPREESGGEADGEEAAEVPLTPFPALPGLRTDWPAPRVGVYGTRSGPLARLEAGGVLATIDVLARLPHSVREVCIGMLARTARALDRRHSDAAREFVQQALGAKAAGRTEGFVLDAWKHILRVVLDSHAFLARIPPERLLERVELVLCDDARKVIASKRGAIAIGAHVGDWETAGAVLPWIGLDPVYVVARAPKNRPLSVRFQSQREARGLRVLPRRGAMQHVPAVIRAGGTVAMLLDQRARKRPVMAPFFGRVARCDRSAGVLLKRVRAPLLFVACYRTGTPLSWRLEIPRVIWPEECASFSVEGLVGVVNRELERMILRAPEQYFWLHERYRGAPVDAEASGSPHEPPAVPPAVPRA